MSAEKPSVGPVSVSVEVECRACGATHVRPEIYYPLERDEPDRTREAKCPAYHPERDAGFEGCGETTVLERVDWWERDE